MSLHFLEDWILCLAGRIKPDGTSNQLRYFNTPTLPIRMAQCDKKFVLSAASAIVNDIGLSDRQVMLSVKIVTKYTRQWAAYDVDPTYLLTDNIPLRLPIRAVVRDKTIAKIGNKIHLRFPYNKELITELYQAKHNACGEWIWNNEDKVWIVSYTEGNIRLLATLVHLDRAQFEIDDEILSLMNRCDSTNALPKLISENGELKFINAPVEALNAINSLFGNILESRDTLYCALVSQRFGFQIDDSVTSLFTEIDQNVGHAILKQTFNYGISSGYWNNLFEFIQSNDIYHYIFVYRSSCLSKVKTRVINAVGERPNISFHNESIDEVNRSDNAIVITDIVMSASNFLHLNIASGALAMLYMIADDEKVNANNKISNKR